ncbi:MAG: T9SS type A sorting domain-containing protein [Ignavibacteria bacterium]|nr:T9SS type A sorting domain-containing protein [Ignavibacteria bacterium]
MKTFIKVIIILICFTFSSDIFSQQWQQRLNGRSVWSLGVNPEGHVFAGGLTGVNSRIWKSYNSGYTWDTIYTGGGQTMWDFAFDSSGNMYVANFSLGLLKSTNGGQNFVIYQSTPYFNGKNLQGVKCGSGGHVFVTTSTGFFRSTDHGATFNETALTGLNCLPVLVDKDSSNIVYVGVSSAGGSGIGVYRSTDNGLTFSSNLLPNANGYNLMQTENGDLYRLTTTSPYTLAKSADKGLSWIPLANLPGAMRGITYYSGLGQFIIYVSGNGGVFKSTDGGLTFANDNFTLTATPVLNVKNPNEHFTLAGVSGAANGGVWVFYNALIQNLSNSGTEVTGYHLSQNYPNPFNPATNISFGIRREGLVSLKIFDIMGKEVITLLNENLNPGNYEYRFDAAGLPGGIYFYRMETEGFTKVKKLMLVK